MQLRLFVVPVKNMAQAEAEMNPVAPRLEASLAKGLIEFTWPVSAVGYELQATPSLATPSIWQPVGVIPATFGNRWRVVLNPSMEAQYFRLVRP